MKKKNCMSHIEIEWNGIMAHKLKVIQTFLHLRISIWTEVIMYDDY